jgi:hypothetical protein
MSALLLNAGVFAPGVISSSSHEGPFAFTPDGQTIYFTRFAAGTTGPEFFVSHRRESRWTEPQRAAMPEGALPAPFCFSPDGGKLFYTHAREGKGRARLWVAERDGNGWKNARPAGGALEKWDADQVSPSVTSDGTLYFTSNPRGDAAWDIYRSALRDGQYAEPELLGAPRYQRISTPKSETGVTVSADGKLLLFSSVRSRNGQGGSDIYSAELPAHERWGAWTRSLAAVNTMGDETDPHLSADGKRLYFCRAGDIYEIELESLRPAPSASTPWKRRADLPSVRQWPQAAVANRKIYVYGGLGVKGWVHEMDVYDPETDTWSSVGPGPEGWKQAVLVSLDDRLILIRRGGPGVAEYRPDLKRWEARPAANELTIGEAQPWSSRTIVAGRKAYTMLSTGDFRPFTCLAEYDLDTGVWSPRRSMPPATAQMAAFQGRIYAFGERTVIYDPSTDQWTETPGMGVPRFEAAPVVIGDEIWLIGGHGTRDEGILGDVKPDIVRLDPRRNQWREGPALPWQRWGSAAIQVNGRLFVIGGIRPGPVWSADPSVFEYVP